MISLAARLPVLTRGEQDALTPDLRTDLIFNTRLDLTIPLGTNKARDLDGRYRAMADTAASSVLTDLGIEAHPLLPDNHTDAVTLVVDSLRPRTAVIPAQLARTDHSAVAVND